MLKAKLFDKFGSNWRASAVIADAGELVDALEGISLPKTHLDRVMDAVGRVAVLYPPLDRGANHATSQVPAVTENLPVVEAEFVDE
jgi:hypothetical protein